MIDKAYYNNKRILAIDYGLKRIGFAYTDELKISINYLPFFENNDKAIFKLQRIINECRIDLIIIGDPLNIKNNKLFKNSLEKFIVQLKENLKINVITIDESNTTEESYKLISEVKIRKSKRKENKDSFSAGIILKNFIEELK